MTDEHNAQHGYAESGPEKQTCVKLNVFEV